MVVFVTSMISYEIHRHLDSSDFDISWMRLVAVVSQLVMTISRLVIYRPYAGSLRKIDVVSFGFRLCIPVALSESDVKESFRKLGFKHCDLR